MIGEFYVSGGVCELQVSDYSYNWWNTSGKRVDMSFRTYDREPLIRSSKHLFIKGLLPEELL